MPPARPGGRRPATGARYSARGAATRAADVRPYAGEIVKGAHLFKHGMAKTPEHNAWCLMKARCHNLNHPRYTEWGGRGIVVCEEWRYDFVAFYRYLGPKPSPLHSVDRIDNEKSYEPGNVRWATKQEQAANRPTWCNYLTYRGARKTLSEWARELGIARESLRGRLKYGWSIEKALTTPKRA